MNRLTNETVTTNGTVTSETIYVLDLVSNRLQKREIVGNDTKRTVSAYDNRDRLLTETVISGATGQSTQVTRFGYDAAGNTIGKAVLPVGGTPTFTAYQWGFENRLEKVDFNPAQGSQSWDVEYRYDADGIRSAKLEAGVQTNYLVVIRQVQNRP